VVVAGGLNTNTLEPLHSVEMLLPDGGDGRWIRVGQMNGPRAWYPAVAVLGGRLTVAGGKVHI